MRARMYDPRLGRFMQADPIISNRISESYKYVKCSPTLLTDPSGKDIKVLSDPNLYSKEAVDKAQKHADSNRNRDLKGYSETKTVVAEDKSIWKQTTIVKGDPKGFSKYNTSYTSLGNDKDTALRIVQDTLKSATQDDHVVIQTHTYYDTSANAVTGIYIGNTVVSLDDFIKALKEVGISKASSLTIMGCGIPKDIAEKIRGSLSNITLYYSKRRMIITPYVTGLGDKPGRSLLNPIGPTISNLDKHTQEAVYEADASALEFDPEKHAQWNDDGPQKMDKLGD